MSAAVRAFTRPQHFLYFFPLPQGPRAPRCASAESSAFNGCVVRSLPSSFSTEATTTTPDGVRRWRQALANSDGVLIASPEYGFSLPGVLKNAIDWVIGSGELEGKIVAVTAAVPAAERGRRGLQALCDTLSAVRATIVGREPIPIGPDFERLVAVLVEALIEAVNTHAARPPVDSGPSHIASL